MSAQQKLDDILSSILQVPADQLTDDVSYEDANWDSQAHLQIVAEIEAAFEIEIDIDEMIGLENIGLIRKLVAERTSG